MALSWIFESKKYEFQAPNNKQISNSNIQHATQAPALRVTKTTQGDWAFVWILEFWSLEFVCYLEFDFWDFNKSQWVTKALPSG